MDAEVIERSLADHAKGIKEFKDTHAQEVTALKDENAQTKSRLLELEQWATSRRGNGGGRDEPWPSPFDELLTHERLEAVRKGMPNSGRIELKASLPHLIKSLFSLGGSGVSPDTGYPVESHRLGGFYEDPRRKLRVLEVLRHLPTTAGSVEYVGFDPDVETTNQADYQALEGGLKAEATFQAVLQTAHIVTIAHWIRASKQVLADVPSLTETIRNLFLYRVLEKLEREIVAGDGVGKNIRGLSVAATPFIPAATNAPDAIGEAIAALDSAGWNPGLVILDPFDWHEIRSERATDQMYVAGGWNMPASPSIWSVPAATTSSLTAGTALVLDPAGCVILDRETPTVMVSTEDRDNFVTNQVTLLAELRAGLAILNPSAIFSVALPGTSP